MTEDAAAWSDHDLDKRFNQGEPYDELTRLAATLDAMLERLSASLRHEQRFTAELSHELRTPLAKIAAEGELALRRERTTESYRESLTAVVRNAEQMTRTVEALNAAARHEAGPNRVTTDARAGVELAVEGIRDEAARNGIDVRMTLPDDEARVAIESDLVERIVHPLLDNALRYGRSEVSVGLVPAGPNVTITVSDDGAGIAIDEATQNLRAWHPRQRRRGRPTRCGPRARACSTARPQRRRRNRRPHRPDRRPVHRASTDRLSEALREPATTTKRQESSGRSTTEVAQQRIGHAVPAP